MPVNGNDIDEGFDSDDFELDPTFVTNYEIGIDEEDFNTRNNRKTVSYDTLVIDCESITLDDSNDNNEHNNDDNTSDESSSIIINDNDSYSTTTTYNDVEDEIKSIYLEELHLEFSDNNSVTTNTDSESESESISNVTLYSQSEDELGNAITNKLTKIEHNTLQRWLTSKECHVMT